MKSLVLIISLSCFLTVPPGDGRSQGAAAAPSTPQDPSKLEQILKEASDLESAQPQGVAEKLAPALAELRQMRQAGSLTQATLTIYQNALLLLMRTQAVLLAPEQDIITTLRELLVASPKIEDSQFNPREKLLLAKVRSAETGRLSLQTTPPGGTLTYMGIELGTTPADVPLMAGTYPLVLRKQGYLDQKFEATIKPSEILIMSRPLQRRTVELPLSLNVQGVSVRLNGQALGTSQEFNAWLASLPADKQPELGALVRQWNPDIATAGFFRLTDVPVDEPVKLEFSAPCYEPLALDFSIAGAEVDWNRPTVVRPEFRKVELKKDVGYLDVTSIPSGGEVWIDGAVQGKTPFGRDVCVGMHRIQVLHGSGQYVREVVIRRAQATKVAGELRPAMAFLGLFAQNPQTGALSLLASDSASVARRVTLRVTAFSDPQVSFEELDTLRKKGSLPLEQLLNPKTSASDAELLIKRIAADAGHSNLLLVGLRSGDKYALRLYTTIHPAPELIEIANMEEASLDFLVAQLNRAEAVGSRLQSAVLGMDLLDGTRGLTVVKAELAAVSGGQIAPGSVIRSVDQKPMKFKELMDYLRTRKAGQSLTLEVLSAKDSATTMPAPLRFAGTEYPWSTPDGFSNSVLAMLQHLVEREPLSDEAKFASLSLARGLMRWKEWKLALGILSSANLEPHKAGICPGTVLYYQGRCYEEMGDRTLAESYYARAKDYPEATLGRPDGISVAGLAERRIQSLKKPR